MNEVQLDCRRCGFPFIVIDPTTYDLDRRICGLCAGDARKMANEVMAGMFLTNPRRPVAVPKPDPKVN